MRRPDAFKLQAGRELPIGRYMGRVASLVAATLIALPAASGDKAEMWT